VAMTAGENGNNQWEWKVNGTKTRLNLGSGMEIGNGNGSLGMGGNGIEKTFPLISSLRLRSYDKTDLTSNYAIGLGLNLRTCNHE